MTFRSPPISSRYGTLPDLWSETGATNGQHAVSRYAVLRKPPALRCSTNALCIPHIQHATAITTLSYRILAHPSHVPAELNLLSACTVTRLAHRPFGHPALHSALPLPVHSCSPTRKEHAREVRRACNGITVGCMITRTQPVSQCSSLVEGLGATAVVASSCIPR